MILKILAAAAAIAASTAATGAAAQSVTPEQVLKLPQGTKYVYNNGSAAVVRTAMGFTFTEGPVAIACNNLSKSGGHGNATVNCTAPSKEEVRFEWIDMNSMKVEVWQNMAAKAGQTQNKPPRIKAIFTRK